MEQNFTKNHHGLRKLAAAFTKHPHEAGETYLQHLGFTLMMAARLLFTGSALVVHGFFPFLCVHVGSKTIRGCHSILDERACRTGGGITNDTPPQQP